MSTRRSFVVGVLLGLLALSALYGCRAFQPEVVVVNRAPETYIIGAPAETSGGYYHFHLYWYGTDDDGEVTKFVWALTDTSVQNHQVDGDEEDQRFNPATNAGTLAIGHYTNRTDSVFDFQVLQGASLAYNRTFHLVAVDDRGDFDRTPARMRFITNAIGNPQIAFYRSAVPGTGPRFANYDTIGYGQPFSLSWVGSTRNIRSYSPELLARHDTVPPVDGLFGYKYRLLDIPCNDASEDCWQPRVFDAASGDSVSFFGTRDSFTFLNDDSGPELFRRRLGAGVHRLLVNTIDMAGVEVPPERQALNYVLNYDPDTRLLRGQSDPFNPGDPEVYPYYLIFRPDGTTEKHTFAEGDTVPDRSYVVFKMLGWDDARDLRTGTQDHEVKFQAAYTATGLYGGETRFPFSTQFSLPSRTPAWERPAAAGGGAADTIGFLVGPFDYEVTFRAVDEWSQRDGTPEVFRFSANRPPCVQCVEVLVGDDETGSGYGCLDAACTAAVDTIYATTSPSPVVPSAWRRASSLGFGLLWFNPSTGSVYLNQPASTVGLMAMDGQFFEYVLALHGADDAREPWWPSRPQDRIMSWNYEIQSDSDARNALAEGAGVDNILVTTYRWALFDPLAAPPQPIAVDDDGVWLLRVKFFVPSIALTAGNVAYLNYLRNQYANYEDIYRLTTLQLGPTRASFIANDASDCTWNSERSRFHYYTQVRVPEVHGLSCTADYVGQGGTIQLKDFAFSSPRFDKRFVLKVVPNFGEIFPQ